MADLLVIDGCCNRGVAGGVCFCISKCHLHQQTPFASNALTGNFNADCKLALSHQPEAVCSHCCWCLPNHLLQLHIHKYTSRCITVQSLYRRCYCIVQTLPKNYRESVPASLCPSVSPDWPTVQKVDTVCVHLLPQAEGWCSTIRGAGVVCQVWSSCQP